MKVGVWCVFSELVCTSASAFLRDRSSVVELPLVFPLVSVELTLLSPRNEIKYTGSSICFICSDKGLQHCRVVNREDDGAYSQGSGGFCWAICGLCWMNISHFGLEMRMPWCGHLFCENNVIILDISIVVARNCLSGEFWVFDTFNGGLQKLRIASVFVVSNVVLSKV